MKKLIKLPLLIVMQLILKYIKVFLKEHFQYSQIIVPYEFYIVMISFLINIY
jgi:hypothetical protein